MGKQFALKWKIIVQSIEAVWNKSELVPVKIEKIKAKHRIFFFTWKLTASPDLLFVIKPIIIQDERIGGSHKKGGTNRTTKMTIELNWTCFYS